MVAQNNRELVLRVKGLSPDELIARNVVKLSVNQVCLKFGIDIESDTKNKFFWNSTIQDKVKITDELLNWLGYTGKYKNQKTMITRLLKKNDYIEYSEIPDEDTPQKKYYALSGIDFASLLMQMRTPKAVELRELYAIMKEIVMKYREYEKLYEERLKELISAQNNLLTAQMGNLQSMMEEERQRAEEREKRAEEERQRAEKERQRAEEERQRADERNRLLQSKLAYGVDRLRNVISKKMAPNPINRNKTRCLSLYKVSQNVWYVMRRQLESVNEGERKIFHKYPMAAKLYMWEDVAHAVDIGNLVKKHYRNRLRWDARGNFIRPANADDRTLVTNEEMISVFERAIHEENEAHELANNIAAL